MDFDLLLVDEDTLEPVGGGGLPATSLGMVPRGSITAADEPDHLFSDARDANDLAAQRWGVIVPEERGGEMLERIARLIDARAAEQKINAADVRRFVFKKNDEPRAWIKENLPSIDPKRPRYLLLLGDLDQVSLELQKTLSDFNYFPGRLAFDKLEDYEAYVDKVLAWQQPDKASPQARAVMMAARTGGADSPDHGYANLMKPAIDLARKLHDDGEDGYSFVLEEPVVDPPVELQSLVDVARAVDIPTLLMTISHGVGSESPDVQGQPLFRQCLTPAIVRGGPFLPGGFWFLFACFGAATPSESTYWHWIKLLLDAKDPQLMGYNLERTRRRLPKPGAAPFVAAVPKAALANPEGPLAVLGHADLAWSYSYQDLTAAGVDPRERLLRLPSLLADRSNRFRAGSAAALFRNLASIDSSLSDLQDREQAAAASGTASGVNKLAYGRLWMHRQDLANYMLLGDPAVRLPIRSRAA